MHLGAMVDLGVEFEYLKSELQKLPIAKEFDLLCEKLTKKAILGTKVSVLTKSAVHAHHRTYKEIREMIESSALDKAVKVRAQSIFMSLAKAEGAVHGVPYESVHFHEIGAVDSIADIVGAAICIEKIGADKIFASTVELGVGMTRCEHGTFPVPPPAVLELLKNAPVSLGKTNSELTTPTGAAILASCAVFRPNISFTPLNTGYGFGDKEFDFPNALRVILGELNDSDIYEEIMIETNIDDMDAERVAFVEELLFAKGALDVYKTPVVTKKNRLGVKLSVLSPLSKESELEELLFMETSTIGVRKYKVSKTALKRECVKVSTKFGEVGVKCSYLNGKLIKFKAEFDDCKALSLKTNSNIQDIYDAIKEAMNDK
jgi:uncharacterized protein (TIGR00299 family) protein